MLHKFKFFGQQLVLLAIIFVLVLGFPAAAYAQDDSPTLPNPVQPVETTGDNVIINSWAAITGIVMAFLAGGVVGITGIGVLMTRVRNDQATLNAIEGLVLSAPPSVMTILQELVQAGRVTLDVIDTISDGQPNVVAEVGGVLPGLKLTADPPTPSQ